MAKREESFGVGELDLVLTFFFFFPFFLPPFFAFPACILFPLSLSPSSISFLPMSFRFSSQSSSGPCHGSIYTIFVLEGSIKEYSLSTPLMVRLSIAPTRCVRIEMG